jgi:hypothetical protein
MIFSENRSPLFRIMLYGRTSMPAADRGAKEIFEGVALSGTNDRSRRRIEMPVSVHDRLGTKAAQSEDEDDALDRIHLTASILGGQSRGCSDRRAPTRKSPPG